MAASTMKLLSNTSCLSKRSFQARNVGEDWPVQEHLWLTVNTSLPPCRRSNNLDHSRWKDSLNFYKPWVFMTNMPTVDNLKSTHHRYHLLGSTTFLKYYINKLGQSGLLKKKKKHDHLIIHRKDYLPLHDKSPGEIRDTRDLSQYNKGSLLQAHIQHQ